MIIKINYPGLQQLQNRTDQKFYLDLNMLNYIISCLSKHLHSYFNDSNILGLWKFVLGMASSNHWGLIIAPGQEAGGNNLGMSFRYSIK